MLGRLLASLTLALVLSSTVHAQTFEITRELGAPQHFYTNNPPFFTSASDALPFTATPNVTFAIGDYDLVRLRLVAPANMKFVVSQAVYFGLAGDLNLIPVGSMNSGTLNVCPTSWSVTTLTGTAPVSTVEGFKTNGDWLKIRATGTSPSSTNLQFTEILLEWNTSAFAGSSHMYTMFDGGGWINGPEVIFYQNLASGAPDPGQAVFLEPLQPVLTCDSSTVPEWPACGEQVGIGDQHFGGPVVLNDFVASDGAGGVFVAWNRNADVFLQHLTETGAVSPGWPANGLAVCTHAAEQDGGSVVPDGSGGAFVIWHDKRDGTSFFRPYLQHISASGNVSAGWPANGKLLPGGTDATGATGHLPAVSNGTGGVIVVSHHHSVPDIVQCVTGAGNVASGWPAAGLPLGDVHIGDIASDGAGGAFLAWDIATPSVTGMRVLRVSSSGTVAAGWPAAGFAATPTGNLSGDVRTVPDLAGGVIITWRKNNLVRAQRVQSTPAIAPGWPTAGVTLSSDAGTGPEIDGDGAGGCLATWSSSAGDILVQRIMPSGSFAPGWPVAGFQIPDATSSNDYAPDIVRDGTGGAFVTWRRDDFIMKTRISSNSGIAPGWSSTGNTMDAFGVIHGPIVGDGCGAALALWANGFTGGLGEDLNVRAMRLDSSSAASECFRTYAFFPGSLQLGPVSVTYNGSYGGYVSAGISTSGPQPPSGFQIVPAAAPRYYDIDTNPVLTQQVQVCIQYDESTLTGPEGNLVLLHYDATAMPPAWVDVTTSRDPGTNTICGLSTLSPFAIAESDPTDAETLPTPGLALRQNIPNPFNPTTTIEFVMPERGTVRLGVFDVSGRLVRTLAEGVRDAGAHRVVWQGNDNDDKPCSSGVYFYRIETAQDVLTRRMVLVR